MPRTARELRPKTEGISPFFIVSDVARTVAFYRDHLGFEIRFQEPALAPFFAIIGRDGAQIFVKSERHPFMRHALG